MSEKQDMFQHVKEFVYVDSWLEQKYLAFCDARYFTMKAALNLFFQRGGNLIVETGCVRMKDDRGAGYSTVIFAECVKKYGGRVISVDVSQNNVDTCKSILTEFGLLEHVEVVCDDSLQFLKQLHTRPGKIPIDLLYLDSFDFPIQEGDGPPEPPQYHCLQELQLSEDLFTESSVVLLDDNNLPFGGKPRMAKDRLLMTGWKCVIDYQQSLWIRT